MRCLLLEAKLHLSQSEHERGRTQREHRRTKIGCIDVVDRRRSGLRRRANPTLSEAFIANDSGRTPGPDKLKGPADVKTHRGKEGLDMTMLESTDSDRNPPNLIINDRYMT